MFDRIVTILLEVGCRGLEALSLRLDCLEYTSGGWSLTRENLKYRNSLTIPISDSLARLIQNQASITRHLMKSGMENPNNYLLAREHHGVVKPPSLRHFNQQLRDFCKKHEIVDELGNSVTISSHSFRHTVGTNLINNGVPQHFVQKYLGHRSPAMTSIYAEIHDSTLRNAIATSNEKITDIRGKIYSFLDVAKDVNDIDQSEAANDIDVQWLRANITAQSLPNGICALPVKTVCHHGNACLTCPSFRTSTKHLPNHIEQRDRSLKLAEQAKNAGYVRQAELNNTVANNLNKIIEVLEVNE